MTAYKCDVTGQKPGAFRHLSFVTNPVLSNFIGKIFFCTISLFFPNYSEGDYI